MLKADTYDAGLLRWQVCMQFVFNYFCSMRVLLFILCITELLLITYLANVFGPMVSPIVFLLNSISIGVLYFKLARAPRHDAGKPVYTASVRIIQASFLCLVLLGLFMLLRYRLLKYPAGQFDSIPDILPQIMFLVKRFLSGQQVYAPIPIGSNRLFPTYFPMQWLPYVVAEALHADYRLVPNLALIAAGIYFFKRNARSFPAAAGNFYRVVLPAWPLIVWFVIVLNDDIIACYFVEALIAAYYLLVAVFIEKKPVYFLAAAISLCLLSRYSIVLWAPLCVAAYFIAGRRKESHYIIAVIFIAALLIFWLPFLRSDPGILAKAYQYHSLAALVEWRGGYHMINGFGFTAWALQMVRGDTARILKVYQLTHIVLCCLTVIILFFIFLAMRRKVQLSTFLLFSFKIYLAVFYAFIQIPYKYLYTVPVLVSSSLLVGVFKRSKVPDHIVV